jgi:hypothetical protein
MIELAYAIEAGPRLEQTRKLAVRLASSLSHWYQQSSAFDRKKVIDGANALHRAKTPQQIIDASKIDATNAATRTNDELLGEVRLLGAYQIARNTERGEADAGDARALRSAAAGMDPAVTAVKDALPQTARVDLKPSDLLILKVLAKSAAVMKQEEIETAIDKDFPNDKPSVRTIGKRLEFLRAAGLVHRPQGKRAGEAITDLGRQVVAADSD